MSASDADVMGAVVARFGGNAELVRQLAALFLEEYPRMLEEMRGSVAAGSADGIRCAAHTLKGAVGNFTTGPAFEAALALERAGRAGDLAEAPAALTALEHEFAQVLYAMRRFAQESACAS